MTDYRDFTRLLAEKAIEESCPISGQWELTFNCNLNCIYCYVVKEQDRKELTFSEIEDILKQLHDAGCLWLCLTGGEPLMRPDFLEIYTSAKKKGFLINIFTNGTLITPKIADYLKEYPPYLIEITLNGITAKTYEAITGVDGSFERCMNGIELIKERKLPLVIKANGMTVNKNEILAIKRFAKEQGDYFRFDSVIQCRLDGSKEPCKFRLSPDEVAEIEHCDPDMLRQWQECFKVKHSTPWSDELFRCEGGRSSFYIDPYGRLMLCHAMRNPNHNLREGRFEEGFYNLFPKIRSDRYKTNSPCKDCDLYYICRQCPGRTQLETGEIELPAEYFCKLAHKHKEISKSSYQWQKRN